PDVSSAVRAAIASSAGSSHRCRGTQSPGAVIQKGLQDRLRRAFVDLMLMTFQGDAGFEEGVGGGTRGESFIDHMHGQIVAGPQAITKSPSGAAYGVFTAVHFERHTDNQGFRLPFFDESMNRIPVRLAPLSRKLRKRLSHSRVPAAHSYPGVSFAVVEAEERAPRQA